MIGRSGYLILGLAFLLSASNVFVKAHSHNENDHDVDDFKAEFGDEAENDNDVAFSEGTEEDHVEVREQSSFTKPKPIHVKDLPTLRFLFCVSCGYKNAYEQFSQFVRDKYPEMVIEGSNYPPAPWKAYLAQALNLSKMAMLVIIMTGSNPFIHLGLGYPQLLQWAQSNKLSACMMTFLLTNMIEGSLMGTGAFEIYLGNEQIWSKLESGRVPSPQELLQTIDSQLELLGKVPAAGAGFGLDFDDN